MSTARQSVTGDLRPADAGPGLRDIGVVVIGRNEGERLISCLASITNSAGAVVYVDSGSSDGSIDVAAQYGARAVSLDTRLPFTAARARNTGFRQLCLDLPTVAFVQFVDGDCELAASWLVEGANFLRNAPDTAVVSGRLRERHPERSLYNKLCDLEWDTPLGQAKACGGVAMIRADPFGHVAGFREDLIAGEEPELCVRLRAAGWKIWRIDAEMALHDAAMSRFSQWWLRSMRSGFAFAQGARLHGAPPERHWVRETRSARVWGLGIPAAVAVACMAFGPWAAAALLVYPAQVARLVIRSRGKPRERFLRAFFLVLGKFPELVGQWRFHLAGWSGRDGRLIEYK